MNKQSTLNFTISLDEKQVPESISWDATDKPSDSPSETKAIAVALWDEKLRNTMRMDLWTKDMNVMDMKQFCVNAIGGIGDTLQSATNDTAMTEKIHQLCQELVKHIEENPS